MTCDYFKEMKESKLQKRDDMHRDGKEENQIK